MLDDHCVHSGDRVKSVGNRWGPRRTPKTARVRRVFVAAAHGATPRPDPNAEAALKLQQEEHCETKLVMGETARRLKTILKKNPLISSPTPVTHCRR